MTWTPDNACSPGCPGYAAFDCGREPREGVTCDGTELEIEACDECQRFTGYERDYDAARHWQHEGRPDLEQACELAPVIDHKWYERAWTTVARWFSSGA